MSCSSKEQQTPTSQIRVSDKILSFQTTPLVSGYLIDHTVQKMAEKELTPIRWHGGKIGKNVFREVLAFMVWVNETHNTEATSRLFYNSDTKEWDVVVMPQKICKGLAAKELDIDKEGEDLLAHMASKGFDTNGSLHSHCNASAFQSGTDERDERKDVGFHITVGTLNKDVADLHCRFTNHSIVYPVVHEDWFEGDINEYLSLKDLPTFPEVWKDRMQKVEYKAPTVWKGYGSNWNTRGYNPATYTGYTYKGPEDGVLYYPGTDPSDMALDVFSESLNRICTLKKENAFIQKAEAMVAEYAAMAAIIGNLAKWVRHKNSRSRYPELAVDAVRTASNRVCEYNQAYALFMALKLVDDEDTSAFVMKGIEDSKSPVIQEILDSLADGGFFDDNVLNDPIFDALGSRSMATLREASARDGEESEETREGEKDDSGKDEGKDEQGDPQKGGDSATMDG